MIAWVAIEVTAMYITILIFEASYAPACPNVTTYSSLIPHTRPSVSKKAMLHALANGAKAEVWQGRQGTHDTVSRDVAMLASSL